MYIFLYFLGGLSVDKAAKRYGIPKTASMDHKNNKCCEATKVWKTNWSKRCGRDYSTVLSRLHGID